MSQRNKNGEPKSHKLRVLLIKEGYTTPEEAIKESALEDARKYKWYDLKDGFDFSGSFFLPSRQPSAPNWVPFINEGIREELPKIWRKSASGILFIIVDYRRKRHILAYTFGHARGLLKPYCYEFDFGLTTVLSVVDGGSIHGMEYKTVGETVLSTLQQTSRQASLNNYDLDFSRDLLRGASGKPDQSDLGLRVDGSDSLAFCGRMRFDDLGDISKKILKIYFSGTWKKRFPGYDSIKPEKNLNIIEKLDEALLLALKEDDLDKIHLAPPGVIDFRWISGYKYDRAERDINPNLDIMDLMKYIDKTRLSIEYLKTGGAIAVYSEEYDHPFDHWPIYKCLIFETEIDGRVYVLNDEKWYSVSKELVEAIDEYISGLPQPSLVLPHAVEGESEDDYNTRVSAGREDIALLHRGLIKTASMNTPVEPCDIYTNDKELIYIKKGTGSKELSHLFAQGSAAASLFIEDKEFRDTFRYRVERSNPVLAAAIPEERPNGSDFAVYFAVLSKPRYGGPLNLPFMSRLNLKTQAQNIRRYGYKVSISLIDIRP